MKVLIIESAPNISEILRLAVTMRWPHARFVRAFSGKAVEESFASEEVPDLVLIGLVQNSDDSLVILKSIRLFSDVPIIVIGPPVHDDAKEVIYLENGADDYLKEPFNPLVLQARVRTILARAGSIALSRKGAVFEHKGLVLDTENLRATRDGREIVLTAQYWELLKFFARNSHRVLTHEVLKAHISKNGVETSNQTTKEYIHRLRKKLGDNPRDPGIIVTHRGLGYSFEFPPE